MNSRFLKWAGCLATALALAACSSEEMADSTQLPEGKYPITFTATGLEAMAVSRVTADGTWVGSEKVAVMIGNDTKEYAADATGTLTSGTPFYWQSKSDSYDVKAWISEGGGNYDDNFPTGFIVSPLQYTESNYRQSDFLYAHDELSYDDKNKLLTFYHQTAKVVVHVIKGDNTPTGMDIENLTTRKLSYQTTVNPQWVAPEGDVHYGECTADYDVMSNFYTLAFEAGKITLPNNTSGEVVASYKFLIVPQEVKGGSALFTITADGYAPFIYTPAAEKDDIVWEAGNEYTYYITIKGSKVTATVTTNSIGWTEDSAKIVSFIRF